eukprot:11580762-Ditylum_brightwellii.AAC.1
MERKNPRQIPRQHCAGYPTEAITTGQVKSDEKTFCQKVWFLVEGIPNLDKILVSWQHRTEQPDIC